jgi:hypothetical protein
MASDDPVVLKAFLKAYPKGAPAEQMRGRLRSLEPQTAFGRNRKVTAAVLLLVLLAGAGLAGLWLYQPAKTPESMEASLSQESGSFCENAPKMAHIKLTDFTLAIGSYISEVSEADLQMAPTRRLGDV